ncbi:MAG: hypothetical protein GEU98_21725 [Pseudonocardiaceae bacterium]|nr:hypothetical protein [Pseudonocardiaceae bacterium]
MASIFGKLAKLANTPQGRKLMRKAKNMANDPHTRQQAKDALDRLRNKGGGSSGPSGSGGSGGTTPPPPPQR